MRVAFVTCEEAQNLTYSDSLAAEALRADNVSVEALPWSCSGADWASLDAAIIRSCWDYHRRTEEFKRWVLLMEQLKVPLYNSPRTILWNIDKFYLQTLQKSKNLIVPTVFISKSAEACLHSILEREKWTQFVIKPAIGLGGHRVWRGDVDAVEQGQLVLNSLVRTTGVLIQQYIPQVQVTGELSLVFVNHEFSHAVLKTPREGDFRTQQGFGGKTRAFAPSERCIENARYSLEAFQGRLLYARVDGFDLGDEFVLSELELIEPHLFLDSDYHAPNRLARAIVQRVKEDL